MTERLTLMDIRDMNLEKGDVDPCQSIPQRNTGVCQSARVDDNGIDMIPLCLMAVASAGVQAQVKAGKGLVVTSNSAVAYSLPRTTLKVTVEVEKESIRKGP